MQPLSPGRAILRWKADCQGVAANDTTEELPSIHDMMCILQDWIVACDDEAWCEPVAHMPMTRAPQSLQG